jgi:hypothetical protein
MFWQRRKVKKSFSGNFFRDYFLTASRNAFADIFFRDSFLTAAGIGNHLRTFFRDNFLRAADRKASTDNFFRDSFLTTAGMYRKAFADISCGYAALFFSGFGYGKSRNPFSWHFYGTTSIPCKLT